MHLEMLEKNLKMIHVQVELKLEQTEQTKEQNKSTKQIKSININTTWIQYTKLNILTNIQLNC
jgi:hypothetical protein